MAIGIHVVSVNFVSVDSAGNYLDKNGDTSDPATIKQMMDTSHEHRVIPDGNVPSSTSWPTVADYLESEAAIDYVLHYMDQNTIVTYEHGSGPLP